MFYHIISDNTFFLKGVDGILNFYSGFDKKKIIISNISTYGLAIVKNNILKYPAKKVIIYVGCIKKRRILLQVIGGEGISVLLLTDLHQGDCEYSYSITLISRLCTKEKLIREILKGNNYPEDVIPTVLSQSLIKQLSAGVDIQSVSIRLGIDLKQAYSLKNNLIRRMGISTTKVQGLLLCRDILEMK